MAETQDAETGTRLTELVDGIRFAMLTSTNDAGQLHARPLTVQRVDDDGTVWFLVDADAEWVSATMASVNVAFTDSDTWVSATGSAELVTDPALLEDLGDPGSDAWFQEGTTPAALKVEVAEADYWDAPNPRSRSCSRWARPSSPGPGPTSASGASSAPEPERRPPGEAVHLGAAAIGPARTPPGGRARRRGAMPRWGRGWLSGSRGWSRVRRGARRPRLPWAAAASWPRRG